MAFGYPSSYGVFVPSYEASGQLTIAYGRSPDRFRLNNYAQYRTVQQVMGYYRVLNSEEAARVINPAFDNIWPDGQPMPEDLGGTNLESFEFVPFRTQRYVFPFTLGDLTVDNAAWDIVAETAGIAASKAMTNRTVRVIRAMTTAANWDADHIATATALGGGQWSAGTETAPYIKAGINAAMRQIALDTLGTVGHKDCVLVVNPYCASQMAESQEIHTYLSQQAGSIAVLEGKTPSGDSYGLPAMLYGLKVVIEDTPQVTNNKGATRAAQFALGDTDAFILARPGGIEVAWGGGTPSFSTVQIFTYSDFETETLKDVNNRRTVGRVVLNDQPVIAAPASGFWVTNAVA